MKLYIYKTERYPVYCFHNALETEDAPTDSVCVEIDGTIYEELEKAREMCETLQRRLKGLAEEGK